MSGFEYGVATVARRNGRRIQCLHCGGILTPMYDLARSCACGRITVYGPLILCHLTRDDRPTYRPYLELDNQDGDDAAPSVGIAIWDQEKGGGNRQ